MSKDEIMALVYEALEGRFRRAVMSTHSWDKDSERIQKVADAVEQIVRERDEAVALAEMRSNYESYKRAERAKQEAAVALGQVRYLMKDQDAKVQEAAELRKDAERINFLGSQNRWNGGTGYAVFLLDSGDVYVRPMKPENADTCGVIAYPDIRTAIDAAMGEKNG